MKIRPLPLLVGAVLGTQALLGGSMLSPVYPNVRIAASAFAEEAAAVQYTCPMHPQIISDKPGTCPICGMDLVPMESHDHGAMEQSGKPVIAVSAEYQQKMGLRTSKAVKSSFGSTLRATGIIMANERQRWDIASQAEGRVGDLKFSAIGDHVKKGDLFYTLASTELQRFQSDYLVALRGGKDQAEGAARRLRLMGVDERVMTELAKTGKAFEHVPFYIPADGVLMKIEIRNGHYLKAGDEVGHIQDISSVWVDASMPETSLLQVKDGDKATVTSADSATSYPATVEHIHPEIMAETRTGIARLVVQNPDGKLRQGGYVTVELSLNQAERLAVPSGAVLRSGAGDTVILALGGGKFQAREVKAGLVSEGKTEILSGLKEGEEIVTSGQFLLDSESSLREGLNKLKGEK